MQKKVLYLTILENTQGNFIHQNQVLNLDDSSGRYLFLFISPLFILSKNSFGINRNVFTNDNVKEIKIPLFSFNFSLHIVLLPILLLLSFPVLVYYLFVYKPQVIHCRNLLSSFIALFCRKIFRYNYKIVSDPRSVYPEEGVIIQRWKLNGFNYKLWKRVEKYTFKNVDVCIGLSDSFKEYLQMFNDNSVYIPAVVDDNIKFNSNLRQKKRKEFDIGENDLIFLYVGSIGLWHDIDSLIIMYNKLVDKFKDYNCKIIALSNSKQLRIRLKKEIGSNCIFCSSVKSTLVHEYLHLSDFGIIPGSINQGFHYDLLYKTMISSKASEYLCSGLPIITNSRIDALCGYVEMYNVGFSYDFFNDSFNKDLLRIYNDYEREQVSTWGIKEFGLSNVKSKLISLIENC